MRGTSNDVMMDQKNQSKINSTNMQVYCSQCLQILQIVSFDAVFNDETFLNILNHYVKSLKFGSREELHFQTFRWMNDFHQKLQSGKELF